MVGRRGLPCALSYFDPSIFASKSCTGKFIQALVMRRESRQERHEILVGKGMVDDKVDYRPFPSWEWRGVLVSFVDRTLSVR